MIPRSPFRHTVIVQEACSNIIKHAQAKHARINISLEAASPAGGAAGLQIEVHDDGIGFDTEQASAGIGLSGMRERVAVVNGRFDVRSELGAGCQIHIFLPLIVDSLRCLWKMDLYQSVQEL